MRAVVENDRSLRLVGIGLTTAVVVGVCAIAAGVAAGLAPGGAAASRSRPTAAEAPGHVLASPAASPTPPVVAGAVTDADVVVYGATPGGIVAAISAARAGASVVLLEPTEHVGGMMSSGLGYIDMGDPRTIGGTTREVLDRFRLASQPDAARDAVAPHLAEQVFLALLAMDRVDVRLGETLLRPGGTTVSDHEIRSIETEAGHVYTAREFIDASYEGDVLADAGVAFRVGREAQTDTGESLAGVRPPAREFPVPTGLPPPLDTGAPGPIGSGDARVQDANYRLCLTTDPLDRVPFTMPAGYDPRAYALVAVGIAHRQQTTGKVPDLAWVLTIRAIGAEKDDVNDGAGISLSIPGLGWTYAQDTNAQRAAIDATMETWTRGLLWFLQTDPSVPQTIRDEVAAYGWCGDEFIDHDHFPRLLYIREARRMVGAYVLDQGDVLDDRVKPDVIAIGSYRLDSHQVSRWVGPDGWLYQEGWFAHRRSPYEIPYRAITPQASDIRDLLVPVAASATHVAWASLRTEPQEMLMGEAAGDAAVLALDGVGAADTGSTPEPVSPIPVQDISVSQLQSELVADGGILALPTPLATRARPSSQTRAVRAR